MPRTKYQVTREIAIEGEAPARKREMSAQEYDRSVKNGHDGCRVIGGDHGDVWFSGYTTENGMTILVDPIFVSALEGLSQDDVNDYAEGAVVDCVSSIGFDAVTSSN